MEPFQRLHFGTNEMIFEPPDTIMVVFSGVVDRHGASRVVDEVAMWSQHKPYVLVLMNVSRVSSISPDARKVLTTNGHRFPPRALALFGGSFATHVLVDLMDRASWLLGSKNRRVKHWPDETSARTWAAEMRNVFATAHAH